MARQLRPVLAGIPLHIVQRGANRERCFFSDTDYQVYLSMLREALPLAECHLHAYVLMTNHVHLLVSPMRTTSAAELMKRVGERYVRYVNVRLGRCGTLWEGRFRSCLVQEEGYLLVCHRYIELNPVRAGMVAQAKDYPWSSFQRNAHGAHNPLIEPHPLYTGLGGAKEDCERIYRSLFDTEVPSADLDQIRTATRRNSVFGTEKFAGEMERVLGRNIVPRGYGLFAN